MPAVDLDAVQAYLLSKPGATEDFPFGPKPLVAKVMGKMFAVATLDDLPPRLTLKCDPGRAQRLRERYTTVQAGYHMSKRHWNTITLDGELPAEKLYALIDHSYDLVVAGLTKADHQRLQFF